MDNIVFVNFECNETIKSVPKKIWQYGYGQILRIQGLNLPSAVEIHFSLQKSGGVAERRIGVTRDGVTDVVIPDFILKGGGIERDYYAYAFIYLSSEEYGQTEHRIELNIISRPEPEGSTGSDETSFGAIMDAVNKIAEQNGQGVSDEKIAEAVNAYMEANPVEGNVTVDTELSETSTNPVQNKVVAAKFSQLQDTIANLKGLEPTDDDIPKVFFGAPLPQTKDDTIMSFRYISNTKDISGYCKTKAQGNSSMSYPKKNQTVKLYKDAECTEKLKVDFKGWGKQNKFCFKANWIDLTHARNIVSARLWGDVVKTRSNYSTLPDELRTSPNQGAVDGFFVKVYAGGVYQGRYTLNIPKDAWMANMDDSLDEHCILCSENYFSGCFRAEAKIDESDWSDEIHDTVPESIKTRWNEVISFVMNSTDEEFINGIDNYIDLESLIDYYCVGVAICHNDGFGKNQLFVTYDGQKWYASYYDLDNTFGAYLGYMLPYNFSRYSYEDFNASYQAREGNLLHIRVEKLFAERIKARYSDLRKNALSVENTINRFERFLDVCPPHLIEEDYATTTANGQFTEIPLQDENNIQQIRDFIVKRYEYIDGFINTLGVDTRLLYSLYDQTFDGTKEQLIKTDVQLFDSPKSFTVFVDATTGEEQPKNVCLVDCAWNSSGRYCGGFQAKTYAYADKNGFMCTGAKSNGGAAIFNDFTSEERTRMVITYRNGLPELQRYRKESDITITTNSPFSKWVEETTHDGTVCIGGKSNGGELFIGTIHALEIYEGVLSDEEINAWLNEGKSED